jgi:hypothetical protein
LFAITGTSGWGRPCRTRLRLMIFAMSNVVRPSFPAASNEMAERLIKAGYLQPALRHDSKAIAIAIAQMKQDLRSQANDGEGPTAA